MMTEDDGLRIDLRRMFPEAVRRNDILEKLKRSWNVLVKKPVLARNSRPVVLGVNFLTVEARNDLVKKDILFMKGNILRFLAGLGYESSGDFSVRIVEYFRAKRNDARKTVRRRIIADEERVRQYMADAPETLPDDINYALSHLRAYLEAMKQGGSKR
ncbi:MAG: hypothetical protein IJR63_06150 [Synergistaceae bacterium]|nr:hypothetical protein [Synergistaceae bacterium]